MKFLFTHHSEYHHWGLLVLRLGLGVMFAWNGWFKFAHLEDTIQFFGALFGSLGPFFAYLVAAIELIGGLLLIVGLMTWVWAALLGIILTVALFKTQGNALMALGSQEAGLALMLLAVLCATFMLFFSGAGRFSLDWRIEKSLDAPPRRSPAKRRRK